MIKNFFYGLLFVGIVFFIRKQIERKKYVDYLKDIGVSEKTISKMSFKELKVSFEYLRSFVTTKTRYNFQHPDFETLESIRIKYGLW